MKTIKIDPRGKYILQVPDYDDGPSIAKTIEDWWNEPNSPIIVGSVRFKIIKAGGPSRLNSLLITLRLRRS